jgi:hypothetical protein
LEELNQETERKTMAKKKVFVSFDFDNDKVLKDFIIGQAKLDDSPFEVIDFSLKEAAPENPFRLIGAPNWDRNGKGQKKVKRGRESMLRCQQGIRSVVNATLDR